jgi:arginase family enzyme
MSLELLIPVEEQSQLGMSLLPDQILGKNISLHTAAEGLPELSGLSVALIGLEENRNSFFPNIHFELAAFRKYFYELFPGNWNIKIADLGDLPNGKTVEDTYFALKEIVSHLRQMNIIPLIIGGSHDLIYPLYQSYQELNQLVNIVSVDRSFDFSQEDELISGRSYMSKIIMNHPNLLNSYTNLGYQSYYCAQEERDLIEKLFFDAIRLGNVLDHVEQTEPFFRDADIVGFDMKCLSWDATSDKHHGTPNGIDSRSICSLARYAGISDRVAIFGIFELPSTQIFLQLLAQTIWYFMEGVNYRFGEYPVAAGVDFTSYTVEMTHQTIRFFKSEKSNRWWMEITNDFIVNNKLKTSTLLPCTEEDYREALNNKLPEKWLNALKRLN